MMRFFIAIVVMIVTPLSLAGSLSTPEKQLTQYITEHQSAQISLLSKLVNVNSGTTNIKGAERVGEILIPELKQLGFHISWVKEPPSMHRAPTLIATRTGKQGKRLLLIGHLDTVFPADTKFKTFTLKKNSAKGPGVIDDKGGLVVLLYALKALNTIHALDNTSMAIVLTGDEEDSGKPASISRKPLIDAAAHQDVALDFEPSITLETATIARRGISNWTISVQGNESHSATIFQPEIGAGAIFEIARILDVMRLKFINEKYLSFNPGIILGGNKMDYDAKASKGSVFGKQNIVAKTALVSGDVRFLSIAQKKSFQENLITLVHRHLQGTKSSIVFEDGMPPMSPTKNNMTLLEKYSQVSKDLDYGKVTAFPPGLRGAGDISYVSNIVPANLSGLGPIGYGTHSIMESVELNSFPIQTKRAALLIYRLTHYAQ
ncbi:MAG: M20/M25/M40 family metallo-hydrolase [Gammaproteobacteria bacterium]